MNNKIISNKKFNSKNRISIKIKSYNKNFIYFFAYKLKSMNNLYRVYRLPKKKSLYTVLRSPFVNKKSRIQYGFNVYSWKFFCDYYDFYEDYGKNRIILNRFLINTFKKNLTAKYFLKIKLYRKSYFF